MEVSNKKARGIPRPTDNILMFYTEIPFMKIMKKKTESLTGPLKHLCLM
jgi:hypothetical protein